MSGTDPVAAAEAAYARLAAQIDQRERASDGPRADQLVEAAARTLVAGVDLLGGVLRLVDELAEPPDGPLRLTGRPGETATGQIWLHDLDPVPAVVSLLATDLVGADGARLPVGLSQSRIVLAAAGSEPVGVAIEVPTEAADGSYHGQVLITDGRSALAVTLEVRR